MNKPCMLTSHPSYQAKQPILVFHVLSVVSIASLDRLSSSYQTGHGTTQMTVPATKKCYTMHRYLYPTFHMKIQHIYISMQLHYITLA